MVAVGDGLGNEITITRATGLTTITDASARVVQFIYDLDGRMAEIKALEAGTPGSITFIPERTWALTYSANDRLEQVTDPEGFVLDIGYDPPDPDPHTPNGRITSIADMRAPTDPAHTYEYRYTPDVYFAYPEILTVTDPEPVGGVPVSALTQSFATTCPFGDLIDVGYTDRRGQIWTYEASRAWEPENGPVKWSENPLGQRDTFVFDADRHMTSYQDANGHQWDYTYDDNGNMLTRVNAAISQTHTWTYNSLNNLTSYTDPENNLTSYNYEVSEYPTLLTSIVEPPDGQGSPEATTTLEYYIQEPGQCPPGPCEHGQLKKVIDPNDVLTEYVYDDWGQLNIYYEGEDPDGFGHVYSRIQAADGGSRIRSTSDSCGGGGTISYEGMWRAGPTRGSVTACTWHRRAAPRGACSGTFPPVPSAAPTFLKVGGESDTEYDGMYRTKQTHATVYNLAVQPAEVLYQRDFASGYDELGQVISRGVTSDEWGFEETREFTYTYDWAYGQVTRVGPDGAETIAYLGVTNRVSRVLRRDPLGVDLLRADYNYYPNGLSSWVMYYNSATVWYEYDGANRLTQIDHKNSEEVSILKLEYSS